MDNVMIRENDNNQNPDRLSRKYSRRARIAVWVTPLLGIGIEAATAQAAPSSTAAITQEMAAGTEQSPELFLAARDKRLEKLGSRVKSAPHLHILDTNKLDKTSNDTIYYLTVPERGNPGYYDWVVLQTRKGEKTPIGVSVALGADSKVLGGIKKSRVSLSLTHADPNGVFTPNHISVESLSNPNSLVAYSVSTVNENGFEPPFGKWTSQTATDAMPTVAVSESVVARQFAAFFNQVEQVLQSDNS
jgi:hypothetical protein